MNKVLIPILLLILYSCTGKEKVVVGKVAGFKPVYSRDTGLFNIFSTTARPVAMAGKIYVKDNKIFQVDQGKGIHVMDNTNPHQLQRTHFIKVPGCEEIAIKENVLYTNNFGDLVVINIADLNNIRLVKRFNNAFYDNNRQQLPPQAGVYFECVDQSKGIVIAWTSDSLINPRCRN